MPKTRRNRADDRRPSTPRAVLRPVPVHRRTIEFEAYDHGDTVSVTARLRDDRPWAAETGSVEHVHDMELGIDGAQGRSHHRGGVRPAWTGSPTPSARRSPAPSGRWWGCACGRGYTRRCRSVSVATSRLHAPRSVGPCDRSRRRAGGHLGRARARDWADLDRPPAERHASFSRNTCHIWADGGPGAAEVGGRMAAGDGRVPGSPGRGRACADGHDACVISTA